MLSLSSLKQRVQSPAPAYFAFIMATGIVSIGAHLAGFDWISTSLFWLNKFAYVLVLIGLVVRLLVSGSALRAELTTHSTGPAFFTIVAGNCVLGIQYRLLEQAITPAILLWVFALVSWLIIVYAFFVGTITQPDKPPLETGLNGTWLLLVVSTQSLAVLGTLLASQLPYPTSVILFGTFCAFVLGFFFYLVFVTLILYRLLFIPQKAEDFTPPYWIDMGAVAITTLAGATLSHTIQTTIGTGLADLLPFIHGISLLAWAVGTWWIPLIILLEVWRHVYRKVPLTYTPQYWSLVFPLGMYMVSSWRLSEALHLPFLHSIAQPFIYVALAAWAATFLAMLVSLMKPATAK
jgi:tellurite resistance protein TehA-like permease